MDRPEADSATFYELLARHWRLDAAVEQLAFDAAGASLAFGLADGRVALAPVADAEPPQDRCRVAADTGRATISPRRKPVPPLVLAAIDAAPVRLAAFGAAGFIAGGGNGRLVRLSASGAVETLVDLDCGPVQAIVPASGGRALVAAGGMLVAYDPDGGTAQALSRLEAGALALAPDGQVVAAAGPDGLAIPACDAEAREAAVFDLGPVSTLSWSPDGIWLAAALGEGGIVLVRPRDGRVIPVPGYPAPVRDLAWSADSGLLATSGAFRIIVWDIAALGRGADKPEAIGTGRAGLVPVEGVAMHPGRSLVAAGRADGTVVIAQVGSRDELTVKAPGQGAARAMGWSRDGRHLALGGADGEAAIITFPPHLFK